MTNIFPSNATTTSAKENIAIQVFGNRIFSDQSLYEYVIEFLLVFSSPKEIEPECGTMRFHSDDSDKYRYWVQPRIGLRRFIFYDRAKRDARIKCDEQAYKDICRLIEGKVGVNSDKEKATDIMYAIQDLLHGYSAVLKNRSWTAQSLLPIAPELIFPEAMLNKKGRVKILDASDTYGIEKDFDFDRHNFMARGGEVYYLHLLQGLRRYPEYRERLETLLDHLLTSKSKNFSSIANWIQSLWEVDQGLEPKALMVEKRLGFIPKTGYIDCVRYSLEELITFLSNEMHPIMRIELLSVGIVLHIMRMLCTRSKEFLGLDARLPWIIDMRASNGSKTVMRLAAESFKRTEEMMVKAINKRTYEFLEENIEGSAQSPFDHFAKAKKHTLNMFRRLGKEMQLVIPLRGGMERFSLSEQLVRFLVLSIVAPGQKMQFDTFLRRLFENYGIVIGPEQFGATVANGDFDPALTNSFVANANAFQDFLKNAGFLRELSDATAIVVNPYEGVKLT
jgi:hypothetical protein